MRDSYREFANFDKVMEGFSQLQIEKIGSDLILATMSAPAPKDGTYKIKKAGSFVIEWTGPDTCVIQCKRNALAETIRLVQ